METMKTPTPEEMRALLEKAQKDLDEALAKMTPAERAAAEARAKAALEKEEAEHKALMERVAAVLGEKSAPQAEQRPKFCRNCGAPAGEGKFCTNCGSRLV